jgi:hypothetical protein
MCKICENNYDDNISELFLSRCKKTTTIPILPNLTKLRCDDTYIKKYHFYLIYKDYGVIIQK